MNTEGKSRLLKETFRTGELEALRAASLQSVLSAARGKRRRRLAARAAALAFLVISTAVGLISFSGTPFAPQKAADASGSARQPGPVEILTEEELFALFPDRPLALIGPPGKQELIFLDVRSPTSEF